MRRTARGVHVERGHQDGACRVAHVMLFSSAGDFERFAGSDELRFDYPLIYVQAKRVFDELLDFHS